MQSDSDLSAEERAAIEDAERKAQGTHWETLGIVGYPSTVEVKRAYFNASKLVHPDRFYGKNLGSYAARLQALFGKVKRAHDVLVDPEQREKYAAQFPPPAPPKTAEELERDRRIEERRKQAIDAKKAKAGASLKGELAGLRGRRLAETVRDALIAKDLKQARASVEQLINERPQDKQSWLLEAQVFEAEGNKALAIERYKSALQLDAGDPDAKKAIERLTGRT